MDLELAGKVALVTGASRGIGRAIALGRQPERRPDGCRPAGGGGIADDAHQTRRLDPARILSLGDRGRTQSVPSGRLGTPKEVADAAVWLVSPRAGWVNGAALIVDGGQSRVIR